MRRNALIKSIQESDNHKHYFEEMRAEDVPEDELEEIALQFAYCDKYGHDYEYWSDGVYKCSTCPSTRMD